MICEGQTTCSRPVPARRAIDGDRDFNAPSARRNCGQRAHLRHIARACSPTTPHLQSVQLCAVPERRIDAVRRASKGAPNDCRLTQTQSDDDHDAATRGTRATTARTSCRPSDTTVTTSSHCAAGAATSVPPLPPPPPPPPPPARCAIKRALPATARAPPHRRGHHPHHRLRVMTPARAPFHVPARAVIARGDQTQHIAPATRAAWPVSAVHHATRTRDTIRAPPRASRPNLCGVQAVGIHTRRVNVLRCARGCVRAPTLPRCRAHPRHRARRRRT